MADVSVVTEAKGSGPGQSPSPFRNKGNHVLNNDSAVTGGHYTFVYPFPDNGVRGDKGISRDCMVMFLSVLRNVNRVDVNRSNTGYIRCYCSSALCIRRV